MANDYVRRYDFSEPLDDCWEVLPDDSWSFDTAPGCSRFASQSDGKAEVYLRPCTLPGDTIEIRIVPDTTRRGLFTCGYIAGFEYLRVELDLSTGDLAVRTHEFHKPQPRIATREATAFSAIRLVRETDALPGLPYAGSRLTVLLDDTPVATVSEIDYLPESHAMFGFNGPGEVSIASWSISGPPRPRPEYVHVGAWQKGNYATIDQNVDALLNGVREASAVGVQILATPETSLTGLRPDDPDCDDRDLIQQGVTRLQREIAQIADAPYTLIGYPEWIAGSEVDGATLDRVKVNQHRWVRPDGVLGPPMAKVHSCEEGLWHGRHYNVQRVAGVDVAMGVCHDGHYQDVWSTGVMAGARLCVHASAGGGGPPTDGGSIPEMRKVQSGQGGALDAYWVHTNAFTTANIFYPISNAKVRDTLLATGADLSEQSPTYPEYSYLGDQLAHAVIRLYDAIGCFPMRTLRSGRAGYENWSRLVPDVFDVGEPKSDGPTTEA